MKPELSEGIDHATTDIRMITIGLTLNKKKHFLWCLRLSGSIEQTGSDFIFLTDASHESRTSNIVDNYDRNTMVKNGRSRWVVDYEYKWYLRH